MTERLDNEEQNYEAYMADIGRNNLAKSRKPKTIGTDYQCPECFGRTVLSRGKGLDSEYYICSRYRESGHMTDAEINDEIARICKIINPSGRFA